MFVSFHMQRYSLFMEKAIDIQGFGTNLLICGTNCLYKINKINLRCFYLYDYQ